jgi:hypothetical protein
LLFYLIYLSQSKKLMQESDLLCILDQSKILNHGNRITGMLLYLEGKFLSQVEGRFMQVLEGREEDVISTFERIKADQRHHDIIVLEQSTIPQRNFGTWSMGFKSMELEDCKILPGYFSLNDDFVKSDAMQESNLSLNFLKSFYKFNMDDEHAI